MFSGLSVLSMVCLIEEVFRFIFQRIFKNSINEGHIELENNSNNTSHEDDAETKNNTNKVEETEEVKPAHDYKSIKDYMADYPLYENNILKNNTDRNMKF